ncbi:MAG: hypothetical protein IPI46_08895 [Bacteroidetes bacterium]|nr:hypothetical protein [Bacteroidota bacterium]
MTTDEVISKIKDATDINWFNTKTNRIDFTHQQYKPEIISVTTLHKFLVEQVDGWDSLDQNFSNNLNNSRNLFNSAKEQVEYFINNFQNLEGENLTNHWNSHVQPNLNQLYNCFTFDSPETQFLYKISTEFSPCFQGALQYIIGNTNSITNKDYFIGAVMAYEFSLNEKSTITQRSLKETEALNAIKSKFQKNVDKSSAQLASYLQHIDDKYKTYTNAVDEYKAQKQTEINIWFDETRDGFNTFDIDVKKRIEELEKTYQEKLRLSKPANYWQERSKVLKSEGWKALWWLVGVIVFACVTLYLLLWFTPKYMLESIFSGNASAIRWSIVYITFISFLAIGIRALSKVMFSSFHLSRDAEEREQLSYFYLALKNESAVDEKDKHLIMQSLFSRADTGLLKEDSAPTMPSGIDKLMNR